MDFATARERMAREQIAERGLTDAAVLQAIRQVPRHEFVPPEYIDEAYADYPLPIGYGQTISQPYIVAVTASAARLRHGDRVLDIGTGSGYAAAIYSQLAAEVWSVELIDDLARRARATLARLGYDRVHVESCDGRNGLADHGPYNAILCAAVAKSIPPTWLDQLADGGRIIAPLDDRHLGQVLVRVTLGPDRAPVRERLLSVRFVPLQ